ncbi:PfkB family carbohydrate kinase [Nocardia sp. alder85J]|uniref:PfkB family carbohydrate kinase n=1 Tax=Nocardia sp. alder85J TaxID=2862949 RepID=UPI001CD367FA|nr:PfkB family carbohydrate kinase [Nocardia sp. alder85J]MCX4094844.1 PfkB family carbohydrate kinase [Nocardia sp. alder85J]
MQTALFAGLVTLDMAYGVDAFPAENSKNTVRDHFLGAGGPTANAAVTYAFLAKKSPVLLTSLGKHRVADLVRDDLLSQQVQLIDATPDSTQQPPVSSIVVARDSGSRTVVSLDAVRSYAPFSDTFIEFVSQATIVLIDGHHPDLAYGVAAAARNLGIPVVLDAGRWKDVHESILPLVDVAICSSDFTPPGMKSADSARVLEFIHACGPTKAAITRGSDPIMCSTDRHLSEIEIAPIDAVDTLGAGDILHGAYCYYATQGYGFTESLEMASTVATTSCQHFGTRDWQNYVTRSEP